ncbi:hypothetical protein SOASR030_02060 [Leminorella grimontii]|uniref:Phage protein n=1 Tax=Leminorella grimontii TaxID=82981 RepID=A0AAV5MYV1_9GAMM|nr:hypothetical protein [Leminorella grimontii]KFC95724.1 phage protein [Leminorella grimontii ATCC 33999 = DSM 5078]GKX54094.1 hypothetical protein SOASR030_02060 [Leminorella grimontii]VFS60090.1 Uncharacterised protein [Leminorella grimontii]
MFKFKITKDEFDALDDSQKPMYVEGGDGYQLAIDGLPDVSGLEKKVNELLGEKKSEQEKRRQAEEEAKKAAEEQARKKGDIEALEKSWQEKLSTREQELLGQVQEKDKLLNTLLVDNVAQSIATKLAGDSAEILLPHIKGRLIVEDGKTRVIDASGNPSAATLEDLEKEFKNNKLFAPVVIGSKASGTGGKGGLTIARGEGKKWNDYTEAERIQLFKEDPEAFKALQATQNQ